MLHNRVVALCEQFPARMLAFLTGSVNSLAPLVVSISDESVEVAEDVRRALTLLLEYDPDATVALIMNTGGMHGE